ncbi:5-oxoprolinase subunit PxpB [Bacillus spongiae]|uniref:5-oxoprolinase subunit PxpB n=1 Tax=Bacillus spongiae TaxID=2683610 RepID=A0ABU8HHK2_9BACI
MNYSIHFMGDSAIIIHFEIKADESFPLLQLIAKDIERQLGSIILEVVPAYQSITIHYTPSILSHDRMAELEEILKTMPRLNNHSTLSHSRKVIIPVCYDEEYAPDLQQLCHQLALSKEEFISLHTRPVYSVHFIGFTPGFPFLIGLPPQLSASRKPNPRLKVKAGSVGIAGSQTGIYPEDSPGGWQIIGRTPVPLFITSKSPPSYLCPGDTVVFTSISSTEYKLKLNHLTTRNDT